MRYVVIIDLGRSVIGYQAMNERLAKAFRTFPGATFQIEPITEPDRSPQTEASVLCEHGEVSVDHTCQACQEPEAAGGSAEPLDLKKPPWRTLADDLPGSY